MYPAQAAQGLGVQFVNVNLVHGSGFKKMTPPKKEGLEHVFSALFKNTSVVGRKNLLFLTSENNYINYCRNYSTVKYGLNFRHYVFK